MISTSITGGFETSQLLTLLAEPEALKERIENLEKATSEYKKYLAAVAPASEVLKFRDEAKADREEAAKILQKAKDDAEKILSEANSQKFEILNQATDEADKIKSEAKAISDSARAKDEAASEAKKVALSDSEKAKDAEEKAKLREKLALEAQENFNASTEELKAIKADILAKHQAFIESIK